MLVSYRELGLDIDELEDVARPWTDRDDIPIGEGGRNIRDWGKHKGNYSTWFDSRGEQFQRNVVGPKRYELIKAGKVKFKDLVDPQTGRLIPWKELKGASGVKGFGSGVVGGELSKAIDNARIPTSALNMGPLALPQGVFNNLPATSSPIPIPPIKSRMKGQISKSTGKDFDLLEFLERSSEKNMPNSGEVVSAVAQARSARRLTPEQKKKMLNAQFERAKQNGINIIAGEQPRTLRLVNDVVSDLKKRGVPVPRNYNIADYKSYLARKGNTMELTAGTYDAYSNSISLNPKSLFFENDSAGLRSIMKAYGDEGVKFYSTSSSHHQIYHEIGHYLNVGINKSQSQRVIAINKLNSLDIKGKMKDYGIPQGSISTRAEKNAAEFVAEVFAGQALGKKYSKEIIDLYRELGGYEL